MFGLFRKDPVATLEKQLAAKMEQAMHAQRNGKMPLFAQLSAEAEALGQELDQLKADRAN